MKSEVAREMLSLIEAEVSRRPSAIEFELAYQARVAIDCIRFAIRTSEQSDKQLTHFQEVNLHLLDALDRLESAERSFQWAFRSRTANATSDTRQRGVDGHGVATNHRE